LLQFSTSGFPECLDDVFLFFEKLDLLGKGGCALVWLAKKIETGETVALK
jgi:hypothetical protein